MVVLVAGGGLQAGKGLQSTTPATKSALQGPQYLHFKVHKNTAPATKSALQGPQTTAPATIPDNEPHVQKPGFTAPATNQSMPKTPTMSKVLPLPQNLDIDKKLLRSPAPDEVDFRAHTRFPLRKSPKMPTASQRERTSVKHRPGASVSRDPAQRNCIWRSQNRTFLQARAAKTYLDQNTCRKSSSVWTHCLGNNRLHDSHQRESTHVCSMLLDRH